MKWVHRHHSVQNYLYMWSVLVVWDAVVAVNMFHLSPNPTAQQTGSYSLWVGDDDRK